MSRLEFGVGLRLRVGTCEKEKKSVLLVLAGADKCVSRRR